MFIHNAPVELPDGKLKTVYEDGRRFYLTPEGNKYPSITSVLGANPEKIKGLMQWRKRVGEVEANKISQKASSRGTTVHKICEDYLNNEKEYINGAMPDSVGMFSSLKPILTQSVGNIYGQELALYSDHLGVAGRVDLIAEWDGVPSIIDFKTSARPKKLEWVDDYFRQCSGYAAMYYEMTDFPIKDVVIAIMVDGDSPQIFKGKVSDWLPSLAKAIVNFKRNM
jgi:genome maintenance exonuclease 1